jgi:thiol-disulfide isomerase/thioredoxin
MTRGARIGAVIAALAVLQLAAIVVFRVVEHRREMGAASSAAPQFRVERLTARESAPAFAASRRDGTAATIAWPAPRPRLVHFWGTWCDPCRRELPSLLAFARSTTGIELVAVAVDDTWADIESFFGGGPVPPEVVLPTDAATHKRYGASTLPDSYMVDRTGQLVERYHGARDWQSIAARDHLQSLLR